MIKRGIKILLYFLKVNWEKEMAYRSHFLIWLGVSLAWTATSLFSFDIVFSHTNLVAGWNHSQALILLGTFYIIQSCMWIGMYRNFVELINKVNRGELEMVLVKPIDSQFLVSITNFSFNNVFTLFLVSPTIIIVSLNRLGVVPSLAQILIYFTLLACGVIICYSLGFIASTLVFFTERLENIVDLFFNFFDIDRVPGTVYRGIVAFLFWTIIPLFALVTIPAQLLLGLFSWSRIVFLIFFAVFSLWFSHRFWYFGLRHYSSASS